MIYLSLLQHSIGFCRLLLLVAVASFASRLNTLEDNPSRLVLEMSVDWLSPDSSVAGLVPRAAGALTEAEPGRAARPWKIFRLALPSKQVPHVRLKVLESHTLFRGSLARVEDKGMESASGFSVEVLPPGRMGGTWVTEIRVALARESGAFVKGIGRFRLEVDYPAASAKHSAVPLPPSLVNPRAARSFRGAATSRKKNFRNLGRRKADERTNAEWILEFPIGDSDHSTFREDGVYAISWEALDSALALVGMSSRIEGLPVNSLALFTGPADTLPVAMGGTLPAPDRLKQVPLDIRDHGSKNDPLPDGTFSEGDSLVFYAHGASIWKWAGNESGYAGSAVERYFSHSPYSFTQSYFLAVLPAGVSVERLKEISQQVSGTTTGGKVQRSARAEKDAVLVDTYFGHSDTETGREWFWFWTDPGEEKTFSDDVLTFDQVRSPAGFIEGDDAWLTVSFFPWRSIARNSGLSGGSLAQRHGEMVYSFSVNGSTPSTDPGLTAIVPLHNPGGRVYSLSNLQSSGNRFDLMADASANAKSLNGPLAEQGMRFDGYTLSWLWQPNYETGGTTFFVPRSSPALTHRLTNAPADLQVVKLQDYEAVGSLSVQSGAFSDVAVGNEDVGYYLYRPADMLSLPAVRAWPKLADGVVKDLSTGRVASGLGSASAPSPEYLIIAPDEFIPQALKLAEFRRSGRSGRSFETSVVRAEDIFREYSSGRKTPVALRDFLRWVYSSWGKKSLRFALLMGDGHYDYRSLSLGNEPSLLPPWEFEDISTDDFFAVLDSGESIVYGNYLRDIMVGRLPVNNSVQATDYLAKIRDHEEVGRADFGAWRNRLIFAADDAVQVGQPFNMDPIIDSKRRTRHTLQTEEISAAIHGLDSTVDLQKIYLVDYEHDASYQKPEANRDLLRKIGEGALFTTYYGHGSSTDWADEKLLFPASIAGVELSKRNTILSSFACTVGRFERKRVVSLSETFLVEAGKGAIATVSATRESYPSFNQILGEGLFTELYSASDFVTLGEILDAAKGAISSYNRQRTNQEKYLLLGEPVLGFSRGGLEISFDDKIDTLQALDRVKIAGSVRGGSGAGKILLEVFEGDVGRNWEFLFNNNKKDVPFDTVRAEAIISGRKIYSEVLNLQGGRFSTDFVTPKKISFGDTAAKVIAYAWNPSSGESGSKRMGGIVIHGTSFYADSINDTSPPRISFALCDAEDSVGSLLDSRAVLALPACVEVRVTDSTGLDFSEAADEGFTLEVEGYLPPFHPKLRSQTGRKLVGVMNFKETDFAPGSYLLKARAQDILGNFASRSLELRLSEELEVGLSDVYNTPNPVGRRGTVFHFKTHSKGQASTAAIKIFTMSGKLVRVLPRVISGKTRWNARDQWGNRLANGLYYYKVFYTVFPGDSENSIQSFSRLQKLVISR